MASEKYLREVKSFIIYSVEYMRGSVAVLLFIVGLLLALLTFPVALGVSAGLGYVFAIIAIILGAYLVAKRAGKTLPLVLGVVLLVIAVPALIGTAFTHAVFWSMKGVVEEVVKTNVLSGKVGEPVKAGDWEITVLSVKEASCISSDDTYYVAKEGYKAFIVKLRIKNVGGETRPALEIWSFVLVTDANKSYGKAYLSDLEYVFSRNVTEEMKARAVALEQLDLTASIAPNTVAEGDMLFQIPSDEEPESIRFKVGITGGYEVAVNLKP